MTRDPVLDQIAVQNPELHLRVVDGIVALGAESAESIASLHGIPHSTLRHLCTLDSRIRSACALRPDCPSDVLAILVHDPEPEVRASLAQNPAIPSDILMELASDAEQRVRFFAYHNPTASDQHRAAVALLSAPEALDLAETNQTADPATSPDRLRELVAKYADLPQEYARRSELTRNPKLPEDCIPTLIASATHPREWAAIWNRYSGLWPSTQALTNPNTPDWIVQTLCDFGHPVALISKNVGSSDVSTTAVDGLAQLINSELLIRALWRELALAEAVELVYWIDQHEGDKFFPTSPSVFLMDGQTPAQYILGGYATDRDWISTSEFLSEDTIMRVVATSFEEDFGGFVTDFTTKELDVLTLSGAAFAAYGLSSLEGPTKFTPSGEAMLKAEDIEESFYFDRQDMDTEVTVTESKLPNICYAETTDQQKADLIKLLQTSRDNLLIKSWEISSHFLTCIALHPDTPDVIRETLLSDSDPEVQHAAQISLDSSQRGIIHTRQSSPGARINTMVFSTLIPERRFEEARIWLSQCLETETGYEFWNAVSNLGIVEFFSGRTEESRKLFEMVLSSGDGPGFEAEEYLQRIESGEQHPRTTEFEYSDDWTDFPLDAHVSEKDQQGHYLRSLRIFSDSNLDDDLREAWNIDRGTYLESFLNSVFETEGINESGVTRETIARSLRDYVERVVLELPSPSQARTQGTLDLAAGNHQRGEMLIRLAAVSGDAEAARLLGTMLVASGLDAQGQAWMNVAQRMTS